MSTFGSSTPAGSTPRSTAGGSNPRFETHTGDKERREGPVARQIEEQTSKLPSDLFLWAALGSMVTSLLLQTTNRRDASNFIGQWAPTLLILGLYNKLVKVAGSDVEDLKQRVQQ
jgi:hypothetical protein